MIKQKSDCRLPKVLVQKVGDVAYIFINLNEEECSETDDEGNVHDYFIYDFNEFHVPVDSFDLKAVEAEPEKYIDYQPTESPSILSNQVNERDLHKRQEIVNVWIMIE